MNERDAAEKRAAWLETASPEDFEAFRPLSDTDLIDALRDGERGRAAAEAQGSAEPTGVRILFR